MLRVEGKSFVFSSLLDLQCDFSAARSTKRLSLFTCLEDNSLLMNLCRRCQELNIVRGFNRAVITVFVHGQRLRDSNWLVFFYF